MSTLLVPSRDGVCDRDVARDEHLDDGLEFRDCRKSSIGISSDLKTLSFCNYKLY